MRLGIVEMKTLFSLAFALAFHIFVTKNDCCCTMDIEQIIARCYPLPPASMERLKACLAETAYPKGHCVLRMGRVERDVFYIKQGIARAYTLIDGKDVTFWIGKEGATIVSMKGYVSNEAGYETVELMEDSVLYALKRDDLQRLFAEDIHIANWGRRYAEMELLNTEQRLIPLLLATASDRYRQLLAENPEFLQRLPLGSIASYLGVTPVSLSRIRAKLR